MLPAGAMEWPVAEMKDGYFEGLPYYLYDVRPQGFLGRSFAQRYAGLLDISEDPTQWTDDDILMVLAAWGDDLPGNIIVGQGSYRRFLDARVSDPLALDDEMIRTEYPRLAKESLEGGTAGSSAGGEFPKFTVLRASQAGLYDAIVKFSGADNTPAVRRWADLLKSEAIAAQTAQSELHIPAARSVVYELEGRTFLEITRFDRINHWGRQPACTIGSIDAALIGSPDPRWDNAASALRSAGLISDKTAEEISVVFFFGQLIANSDMHGGNLAMRPENGGFVLTPIFDMLPMLYAPPRGGELPAREYAPRLPFPNMTALWRKAAKAALAFWDRVATEKTISSEFREIAAANATILSRVRVVV